MECIQAGTVSIGGGIIMLLAANSISGGSLSIGEFSLFISYLTVIGEHSVYLGGWGTRLRQLRVSFDRMTEGYAEVRRQSSLVRYSGAGSLLSV